mgnify:CR=1 FL=1
MQVTGTLVLGISAFAIGAAFAQSPLTPAPAGTSKRGISGGGSFDPAGITVTPSAPPKTITKKITYMALTKKRQWISSDGKSIIGTLLAFDAGDEKLFIPPTVIKDDRVRLLKDSKEFVLPIDRLSAKNQDEILAIEDKVKASYAAMKKAAETAAAAAESAAPKD